MLSVPAHPMWLAANANPSPSLHWHLDCLRMLWQLIRCGREQTKRSWLARRGKKKKNGVWKVHFISFFFFFLINEASEIGEPAPHFSPFSGCRETFLLPSPHRETRLVYLEPVAAPRTLTFFFFPMKIKDKTQRPRLLFLVCLSEQNCILNINCLLRAIRIPVFYFWG